jgi:hypothetical protein
MMRRRLPSETLPEMEGDLISVAGGAAWVNALKKKRERKMKRESARWGALLDGSEGERGRQGEGETGSEVMGVKMGSKIGSGGSHLLDPAWR